MATRIIPCNVTQEYIQGSGVVVGAAGSHDDVILRLTFNDMWNDLSIYATFRDALGENPTVVVIVETMAVEGMPNTYDLPIPALPKGKEGRMMLTLSGYSIVNDSLEDTATVTTTAYFRVMPSDYILLDDGSIDATIAQQLLTAINYALSQRGHVIVDKDGNEMTQRNKLKFAGESVVTDDGVHTIVSAVRGPQGPQGPEGPEGPQGPGGESFTIKGLYATLSALEEAHPIGNAGDAYAVGTDESNTIYIWDVDQEEWTDIGGIQGPAGASGVQYEIAVTGTSLSSVSANKSFSEIAAAYEDGDDLIVNYNNGYLLAQLEAISSSAITFVTIVDNVAYKFSVSSANAWTAGSVTMETASNKLASYSATYDASTTVYPSMAAMLGYIAAIKAAASGLASLDSNSKVTASQASSRIVAVAANKTLGLSDAGTFQNVNSSSNLTITIPLNSSVAFPTGTEIEIYRGGTGTVTIAATSGVTLNSPDGADEISVRYGCAVLKKIDTNVWVLGGVIE